MLLFVPNETDQPGSVDPEAISSFMAKAKLYVPSTPNNSNETHTFMCLGRTGHFGQR